MIPLDTSRAGDPSVAAGATRLPTPHPRSATGALTGLAGVAAALVAIVVLQHWLQPVWLKALIVAAVTALAMIAVEMGRYRSHLNPTTGLALTPLRPLAPLRVLQKLMGFWLTCCAVAAAYAVIPEYAGAFYNPFKSAALWSLPAVAVAAPFYIGWIDRRQRDPDDAYLQIGRLLMGRRPPNWTALAAHLRAWGVKAFFLPLMFVFLAGSLRDIWSIEALPLDRFDLLFPRAITLLYLIDVLIAVVGYSLTLRLIDTHVRSVDRTTLGWVICLVCYQPFWNGILAPYMAYERDGLGWTGVFAQWPVLYLTWGLAILALVAIYAWATVSFGLRFSNLTNRGVITSGPYRWGKHPAYVCKCLSFWMISMPFIAGAGWAVAVQSCLLLAAGNLIYVLRARTEERHLMQDPAYRDYADYIAEHGLVARLTRAFRAG